MSDPELRIEQTATGRGIELPRPVDRSLGDLLDRLADRLHREVEAAELETAGGGTIRIVDLSEVDQWLRGCAIRLRSGEHL